MGFQWQFDIPDDAVSPPPPEPPVARYGGLWVLLAAGLVALVLWGWVAARQAQERAATNLTGELQQVLELERTAVREGDGELFLAQHVDAPDWISLQFRPWQQAFARAERRVTRAEEAGDEAWANVNWEDATGAWQRLAFFDRSAGRWRRAPTSERFWGPEQTNRYAWGNLTLSTSDAPWADAMARFIASRACCTDQRLSITVSPANVPFGRAGDEVVAPSPRLVALDAAGEPGEPFWALLAAQLAPAEGPLRYVVPDAWAWRYEQLADDYRRATGVAVQILPQGQFASDPLVWLGHVDGAQLAPTAPLITAGLIADLTSRMEADPAFAAGDFYAQIWAGSWWQGRMWQVPASAALPVIYYNRAAFAAAGLPLPTNDWTWADLTTIAEQLGNLTAVLSPFRGPYWGLVDGDGDVLWGIALNYGQRCAAAPCLFGLEPGDLDRAWRWYAEQGHAFMPDLSGLDDEARALAAFRWKRLMQAGMWVGHAVEYEDSLVRLDLGLAPFPRASDQGDVAPAGITPLHVTGHVISGASQQPERVWDWIRFLSEQPPYGLRDVPARPSVAAAMGFWQRLPAPLAEVLTTAFPRARPVFIEEADWLRWDRPNQPPSRPAWFPTATAP